MTTAVQIACRLAGITASIIGGEISCFVLCSWFFVRGSWFLVRGSWFLVRGSWFLVRDQEPRTKNQAPVQSINGSLHDGLRRTARSRRLAEGFHRCHAHAQGRH